MANEEQLAILKQGVEVWNEWRETHLDEKIDLSEAELPGSDLSGVNFTGAKRGAIHVDLVKPDFDRANIGIEIYLPHIAKALVSKVNLRGANLRNTKLRNTKLRNASLFEVNLMEADLTGAHLNGTDLSGADLRGANL